MRQLLAEAVLEKVRKLQIESWDEDAGLLFVDLDGRNYHTSRTSGRVHNVRDNAGYALALLGRMEEGDLTSAVSILEKVLAKQDRNPDSETYGIWPYLFEEPLDEMLNPDWNWASFIGSALLIALHEFSDILAQTLQQQIREALLHVCRCIVRRNMGIDYTNICIMSSYVAAVSGELLGRQDFVKFGMEKLSRMLESARLNGSISEFNSPDYIIVDLVENGHLLRYAKNPQLKILAKNVNWLLWRDIAAHFHAPTGQLAPPHTRCYADIKGDALLSVLELGTNGRWNLLEGRPLESDLLWPYTTFCCPEEFIPMFGPLEKARIVELPCYRGEDLTHSDELRVLMETGQPAVTAVTYLHPQFCLGSFSRHDLWNQRRPLMAYLKGPAGTAALRMRCLHDGTDFSSSLAAVVQRDSTAAGVVGFLTDHGDYHYILDQLKDGTVTARSLCIRFSIEGPVDKVSVLQMGENDFLFQYGDVTARLHLLWYGFDGFPVDCSIFEEPESKGVELILFLSREPAPICLSDLKEAGAAFTLDLFAGKEVLPHPCVTLERLGSRARVCLDSENSSFCTEWVDTAPKAWVDNPSEKIFEKGGFRYSCLSDENKKGGFIDDRN